ncbi:LVIVD repeat-containing protein [Halorussus halophilus]|uniref:LVIVD repeat-containing protein n=1 Tax=Halorussus halophilus TaxID=2650975 RepID=UPI0013012064|nr:hypothetical protein [Halorussus halophilus]
MRRRTFLGGVAGVAGASLAAVGYRSTATQTSSYEPLGSVEVAGAKEAVVGPDGETAFLAVTDGFATVDVSDPTTLSVLAERRDLSTDGGERLLREIWDVKVDGDRLAVAGPANPTRESVAHGVLLYDVRDPANPEKLAFHETEFSIHNCDFVDGFVYLTGNNQRGNPLVIVDVRDDVPAEVGRWSMLDVNERWSEVDWYLRWLHDVYVHDGMAYLAHWDAGTWLVDVSDPTNPQYVSYFGARPLDELAAVPSEAVNAGVLGLPGNDHYTAVNDDGTLLGVGRESWSVDGEGGPGGVELWDVSDPASPQRRAYVEPPGSSGRGSSGKESNALDFVGVAAAGGGLDALDDGLAHKGAGAACHDKCGRQRAEDWTTAHNFDFAGDRLYTSWYQGGVKIHDVSDPASPTELATWRDAENTSFWTAQRASDRFFVASSIDYHADTRSALYAFPNRAAESS